MIALFTHSKPVIGVIHVGALPGTPLGSKSVAELVREAKEEARVYRECGVDGARVDACRDLQRVDDGAGTLCALPRHRRGRTARGGCTANPARLRYHPNAAVRTSTARRQSARTLGSLLGLGGLTVYGLTTETED